MYWITKIGIDNFKAFPSAIQPVEIKPLNHLLIYGENGSGKSSVYKALRSFFRSSGKPEIVFELNEFSKKLGNSIGTVELEISEIDNAGNIQGNPSSHLFSSDPANSTNAIPVFQLADKLKAFLDYKAMLKAHFINVREDVNPNIFNFLVREILSDSQIPNPAGGTGFVDLLSTYQRLSDDITKNAVTTKKHQSALAELIVFNSSLNTLLRDVFGLTNKYFKEYFQDPKISVDLKISEIELTEIKGKKRLKEEIFFKISYAGTELPLYHIFLNEARLSALAISIFFASIKVYPLAAVDLRVIFLDDVFIGLDNSNRIPLLKLLKKEFTDENFQLIISSYDKEWFELVKQWFSAENLKYKAIEMYFDRDDDSTTPDKSVIINSKTNFEKAEDCFKRKDYTATGNFLRKECEYIIKTLLPDTFKVTIDGNEINELEVLLQKLSEYYSVCGIQIPQGLINSIKIYRKLVLNPSSHADLKCPIYRSEVLDAFQLVRELKVLPRIERLKILNKGSSLKISFSNPKYRMELHLAENLYRFELNGVKSFCPVKYLIDKWKYKDMDFGMRKDGIDIYCSKAEIEKAQITKKDLSEIFVGINKSTGIPIPQDLNSVVMINSTGSLKDLLN